MPVYDEYVWVGFFYLRAELPQTVQGRARRLTIEKVIDACIAICNRAEDCRAVRDRFVGGDADNAAKWIGRWVDFQVGHGK